MKRILLSGGATGGHLFPGVALASAIESLGFAEPIFLDSGSPMEDRILGATRFRRLDVPRFRRQLAAGKQIWGRLGAHFQDPGFDAVVALGAGQGFLPGLRAWLSGVPVFILEQNRVMGKANRYLLPLCKRAFLSMPLIHQSRLLRSRMQILGSPVRSGVEQTPLPVEGVPMLLVFGGSQGAASINDGIIAALEHLKQPARLRVIHVSGPGNSSGVATAYRQAGVLAEVHEFLQDPAQAIRDASLILCRAGGSTIAELCTVGRGAVLMPYLNHSDRHQEHNASYLEDGGAALIAPGDPESLAGCLEGILHHRTRLEEMAKAAVRLGHPEASWRIAETIATHLEGGNTVGRVEGPETDVFLEVIR